MLHLWWLSQPADWQYELLSLSIKWSMKLTTSANEMLCYIDHDFSASWLAIWISKPIKWQCGADSRSQMSHLSFLYIHTPLPIFRQFIELFVFKTVFLSHYCWQFNVSWYIGISFIFIHRANHNHYFLEGHLESQWPWPIPLISTIPSSRTTTSMTLNS